MNKTRSDSIPDRFRVIVICLLIISIAFPASAADGVTYTPVQVSLVPGFGTHPSGRVEVDFSFNILAGRIASLRKFELGTLLNWETDEMNGFQIGGLANLVEGRADGVQLAGLANLVRGELNSVSLAGLGTYARGDATGIGAAGLAHYAGRSMTGIYLAGLANYSGGDNMGIVLAGLGNYAGAGSMGIYLTGGANYTGDKSMGIYLAGLGNYTRDEATGIHLASLLNYSGDYTGIQMALVNYAEDVAGIQVGLVNYAGTLEGIPIGLVSYVRSVPLRLDLWASETALATVAVRSGNRKYYNLLALGINPYDDRFHWTLGWGFGREYRLSRRDFFDMDLMLHGVLFDDYAGGDVNLLTKLRFLYGYEVSKQLALYGGPTLNLFVSDVENAEKIALWGPSDPTWERGDRGYYFWPGLVLGIRL